MKPTNLHDMLDALDDLEVASLASASLPSAAEGFVASPTQIPQVAHNRAAAVVASSDPDALDSLGAIPWHGGPSPVRWWRHSAERAVIYVEIDDVVARAHRGDVFLEAEGGTPDASDAYWLGAGGVLLVQRSSGQVLIVRGGRDPSLGVVRAGVDFPVPPAIEVPALADWLGAQEPWLEALYARFAEGNAGDACLAIGIARRLARPPRASWKLSPLDPSHPARVPIQWRHALSAAQVTRAREELRERLTVVHDDLIACIREDSLPAEVVMAWCQQAAVVREGLEGVVDLDLDAEGQLRSALDALDESGEVLITLRGLAGALADDPAAAAIAANLPDAWWGTLGER